MADYRFKFRRIASDREGYFYDRWDRAIPMSVETREQIAALVRAGAKRVTDRVRELHRDNASGLACVNCGEDYPCRTILLLDRIDTEMACE